MTHQKSIYIIGETHLAAIDAVAQYSVLRGKTEEAKALVLLSIKVKKELEEGIKYLREKGIDFFFSESNPKQYNNADGINSARINPIFFRDIFVLKLACDGLVIEDGWGTVQGDAYEPLLNYLLNEVEEHGYNKIGLMIGSSHVELMRELFEENNFKTEIVKKIEGISLMSYLDEESRDDFGKLLYKNLLKK